VSETAFGSFGMGAFNDTAVALGVTGLPGPNTDTDADWFVHQGMTVQFDFLSSVGFYSDGGHHYTIDSKAMRKILPDEDVAIQMELGSAVGAEIAIFGRLLIKLH